MLRRGSLGIVIHCKRNSICSRLFAVLTWLNGDIDLVVLTSAAAGDSISRSMRMRVGLDIAPPLTFPSVSSLPRSVPKGSLSENLRCRMIFLDKRSLGNHHGSGRYYPWANNWPFHPLTNIIPTPGLRGSRFIHIAVYPSRLRTRNLALDLHAPGWRWWYGGSRCGVEECGS